MNAGARSQARAYLSCSGSSFWRWSEDGGVLTWRDGTTIAFREEVEQVLWRLAPGGLPPFEAVVLLVAASRDGWPESSRALGYARAIAIGDPRAGTVDLSSYVQMIERLGRVHSLPPELRSRRPQLAEFAFEGAPGRGRPGDADQVLEGFLDGIFRDGDPGIDERRREPRPAPLLACLEALGRLDPAALERRLATGLEAEIHPAPIEFEAARSLIAQLGGNPEHAALARLARDLMAAVHVPRSLVEPEALPVGGFSDITNRGPLDRILASELAHDDEFFAVRVALGEALYLRREAPPRQPSGARVVLVDAGIRMWGVPRVFGTAVLLALAATAPKGTRVFAFRAAGSQAVPIDLASTAGVESHLAALETDPHAGEAAADLAIRAALLDAESEPIVVTHRDAAADPDFRRALGERHLLVASVARDGEFRLESSGPRGRRLLSRSTMRLEDLHPARLPILSVERDPNFPAILAARPFPILLPSHLRAEASCHSDAHGVVTVTRDGRLLHWPWRGKGARQLADDLPRGKVLRIEFDGGGRAIAILGSRPVRAVVADLATGEVRQVPFEAQNPGLVAAWREGDAAILIFGDRLETYGLDSGALVGTDSITPPGARWLHGRFFRSRRGAAYAMAFDGRRPALHAVGPEGNWPFDRTGVDGPWLVTSAGDVISSVDRTGMTFNHNLAGPVHVRGASRDGKRVVLREKGASWVVLDLETRRITRATTSDPQFLLEPDLLAWTRTSWNLRRKFQGVGVDAECRVGLRVASSYALRPEGLRWFEADLAQSRSDFGKEFSPPGVRYELRRAEWKDGSRAFLDSRGLVHFQSSVAGVPEVTLVTVDRAVVAWLSTGETCGPSYFFENGPTTSADRVLEVLRRFGAGLR